MPMSAYSPPVMPPSLSPHYLAAGDPPVDLDQTMGFDEAGDPVRLKDLLPSGAPPIEHSVNLRLDLEEAAAKLPPALQTILSRLREGETQKDLAARMGMPIWSFQSGPMKTIRAALRHLIYYL